LVCHCSRIICTFKSQFSPSLLYFCGTLRFRVLFNQGIINGRTAPTSLDVVALEALATVRIIFLPVPAVLS
jgi:hypothetical protein